MTAPIPPRASRRGVLTVTLAALTASGCDAIAPGAPAESEPTSPIDPPGDPDEALVGEVRADLTDAALLVASAIRSRPALRRDLVPFVTLHARHLRALDSDRPRGRGRPVTGDAATVRAAVRDREERLRVSLAAAAVSAESGPLAALLASMSAAVAQQLVAA